MRIRNEHRRTLPGTPEDLGALLETLATREDRLWPREHWPHMVLKGGKVPGSSGGHGPVRYTVESYEPGEGVLFRFLAPKGFNGTHGFRIESDDDGVSLVHLLEMRLEGPAWISWPLIFRPLHDALLEDALDKASAFLEGKTWTRRRWSLWVRVLRWILARNRRPSPSDSRKP